MSKKIHSQRLLLSTYFSFAIIDTYILYISIYIYYIDTLAENANLRNRTGHKRSDAGDGLMKGVGSKRESHLQPAACSRAQGTSDQMLAMV